MRMNSFLKWLIIAGLAFIVLIPIIPGVNVATHLFFPFITGKNFAFRIAVELIFGAYVILALREASYRPKSSWLFWAIGIFLGIMALADATGVYPFKSFWSNYERMEGYVTLAHLGALFLVASAVLNTEKMWERMLQVLVGLSFIVGLYGIFQLFGKIPINQGGVRLDGPFGNAAYFAAFMLMSFFLTLFLIARWHHGRSEQKDVGLAIISGLGGFVLFLSAQIVLVHTSVNLALGLGLTLWAAAVASFSLWKWQFVWPTLFSSALALQVYIIYHTATRGAILGLIFGLLVTALLVALYSERGLMKKIATWAFVSVLVILAAGAVLKNTNFVKNDPTLVRITSISAQDAGPRFMVWGMAWKGFLERPVLGWGQEAFNYVFNKYYDPGMYAQEQWFDRTHNIIFDWLIAGGIFGLASYLFILVSAVYYVWKQGEKDFSPKKCLAMLAVWKKPRTAFSVEKSILTGFFAAYFFQNLFVFDNVTSYIILFFVLSYIHFLSGRPFEQLSPTRLKISLPTVNSIVMPITAIVIGLVVYIVNINPIRASATLIQALQPQPQGVSQNLDLFKKALSFNTFGNPEIREQLAQAASQVIASQSVDVQTKEAFYEETRAELVKQVTLTPKDARYWLFLGSFLNRSGNYNEAITALKKAVENSPTKQTILFELGSSYLNAGDSQSALATMKQAFDLEPKFSEARIIYALAAVYAKNYSLADEIMAPYATSTYIYDPRLMQAYNQAGLKQKVLEAQKEHVALTPDDPQAHILLANAYIGVGDKQDAIVELNKAAVMSPQVKDQVNSIIKTIQAK